VATASGSLGPRGDPLVFSGIDAASADAVGTGLEQARSMRARMTLALTDEPDDRGDALSFIDHVETDTTPADCTETPAEDTDEDGARDTYSSAPAGAPLCWQFVPSSDPPPSQGDAPSVYVARVTVLADGSPVDVRRVYFVVTPD
jgi:hypothetical protein